MVRRGGRGVFRRCWWWETGGKGGDGEVKRRRRCSLCVGCSWREEEGEVLLEELFH